MGKILGIVAIAAIAIVGVAVAKRLRTAEEGLESGVTPVTAE